MPLLRVTSFLRGNSAVRLATSNIRFETCLMQLMFITALFVVFPSSLIILSLVTSRRKIKYSLHAAEAEFLELGD